MKHSCNPSLTYEAYAACVNQSADTLGIVVFLLFALVVGAAVIFICWMIDDMAKFHDALSKAKTYSSLSDHMQRQVDRGQISAKDRDRNLDHLSKTLWKD